MHFFYPAYILIGIIYTAITFPEYRRKRAET